MRSCTPIRRGWETYLEMAKDSSHLRLLLLLSLSSSYIFILNCTDLLKSPSESSIRFKSGEKESQIESIIGARNRGRKFRSEASVAHQNHQWDSNQKKKKKTQIEIIIGSDKSRTKVQIWGFCCSSLSNLLTLNCTDLLESPSQSSIRIKSKT